MKKGWEIKKLGEVANICLGLTHTPKYVEEGIPFISVKDISQGTLSFEKTKRISLEEFQSMPNGAKPQKGDVLFCRVGTIELPQVLKTDIPFGIFVSVGFLRAKKNIFNEYLKYWMTSSLFYNQVNKNVQGSTLKNLNTGWLKNFEIPVPPLSEQERIVAMLDATFAKIDALKANAQQNLQNAKDLFQQVLKQELAPKDGWVTKKLGEVCEYIKEQGNYLGLPYIGMEDIEPSSNIFLGKIEARKIQSSTFKFKKGNVLFGRLRPYLRKVIIPKFDGHCSTEIFPIKTNQSLNAEFLFYWFLQDSIIKKINATCTGTRMPRANMNEVLTFDISLPSEKEQQRIVETLNTLSAKCKQLEENYRKTIAECDALKQAILREAFCGEIPSAQSSPSASSSQGALKTQAVPKAQAAHSSPKTQVTPGKSKLSEKTKIV